MKIEIAELRAIEIAQVGGGVGLGIQLPEFWANSLTVALQFMVMGLGELVADQVNPYAARLVRLSAAVTAYAGIPYLEKRCAELDQQKKEEAPSEGVMG